MASFRALPEFKELQEEVISLLHFGYLIKLNNIIIGQILADVIMEKLGTDISGCSVLWSRYASHCQHSNLQARLGGEDIGYSFRRDLKLISEVQAPFRGVRRFFSVALSSAAGISLLFTVPRLIRAIQGGEGAPDLIETAQNVAINIGGNCYTFYSALSKLDLSLHTILMRITLGIAMDIHFQVLYNRDL